MPVYVESGCTKAAVYEALRCQPRGQATYETDDNELLAKALGFSVKQANVVFGHLKQLRREDKVGKQIRLAEPRRLHERGPRPAPVRVVMLYCT